MNFGIFMNGSRSLGHSKNLARFFVLYLEILLQSILLGFYKNGITAIGLYKNDSLGSRLEVPYFCKAPLQGLYPTLKFCIGLL